MGLVYSVGFAVVYIVSFTEYLVITYFRGIYLADKLTQIVNINSVVEGHHKKLVYAAWNEQQVSAKLFGKRVKNGGI